MRQVSEQRGSLDKQYLSIQPFTYPSWVLEEAKPLLAKLLHTNHGQEVFCSAQMGQHSGTQRSLSNFSAFWWGRLCRVLLFRAAQKMAASHSALTHFPCRTNKIKCQLPVCTQVWRDILISHSCEELHWQSIRAGLFETSDLGSF